MYGAYWFILFMAVIVQSITQVTIVMLFIRSVSETYHMSWSPTYNFSQKYLQAHEKWCSPARIVELK